ncbi:hypothetical protein [Streptomyces wuyuanensis]|uniref:hypothetical protein n=1 Tax=Streptomyces wuyuanensis TaxID=1196353 RepID=UPI00341B4DCA
MESPSGKWTSNDEEALVAFLSNTDTNSPRWEMVRKYGSLAAEVPHFLDARFGMSVVDYRDWLALARESQLVQMLNEMGATLDQCADAEQFINALYDSWQNGGRMLHGGGFELLSAYTQGNPALHWTFQTSDQRREAAALATAAHLKRIDGASGKSCCICYDTKVSWNLQSHDEQLCQTCAAELLKTNPPRCPLCRADLRTGEAEHIKPQVGFSNQESAFIMNGFTEYDQNLLVAALENRLTFDGLQTLLDMSAVGTPEMPEGRPAHHEAGTWLWLAAQALQGDDVLSEAGPLQSTDAGTAGAWWELYCHAWSGRYV